ncbi:MAG: DUF3102 domain-containing protein [Oscillospiraceae bacterium]|nr:DUF3102 domain-containing protein [Oscillospiraceae bacterium]
MNENHLALKDVKELSPAQLGGEIRLLTAQARRMALSYGIQIGYRLKIAHEKVGPHGWADWLKAETDFSAAAASRFEKLYEGYGADQGSLFGVENKFPTLEKLSISNALRLLAVPEEDREAVAEELDAEHLSARELEKALAERDAWIARAKEAEKALDEEEDSHGLAIAELEEKLDAMQKDAEFGKTARQEQEKLMDELDKAKQSLVNARAEIKELESRPQPVAVQRDEKAIQEAATAARAKAEAEAQEKLNALQKKLEKAEKAREKAEKAGSGAADQIAEAQAEAARAREELETAKKKLLAANKEVAEVGVYFRQLQMDLNEIQARIRKIRERDNELAEKLAGALHGLLAPHVGVSEE